MTEIWTGGEDEAGFLVGNCTVATGAGDFNATYSRCAMKVTGGADTGNYYASQQVSLSGAWWTMGLVFFGGETSTTSFLISWADVSAVQRLALQVNSSNHVSLVTKNGVGTVTVLATSSAALSTSALTRIDVYINFLGSGSGQFSVYAGGTLLVSYTGNIQTDGVTTLTSVQYGGAAVNNTYWSQCRLDTIDTRGITAIATLVPAANGNTVNWDVGGVSNINEITDTGATNNASGTAAQLQQYTIAAPPAGNYTLRDLVVSTKCSVGATGPQNIAMNVRTASTDYTQSDASPAPATAVAPVQTAIVNNPNTGVPWTRADLVAAGFNIGMASAA